MVYVVGFVTAGFMMRERKKSLSLLKLFGHGRDRHIGQMLVRLAHLSEQGHQMRKVRNLHEGLRSDDLAALERRFVFLNSYEDARTSDLLEESQGNNDRETLNQGSLDHTEVNR